MKIPWFAFVLLASTLAGSRAQVAGTSAQATVNPTGTALPAPTAYAVVSRDANSRVWERTVYERGPSGQAIPRKHRYVETATGLNYKDSISGQWVEAKEEIDILPQGGAAAAQGQHRVNFPGDLYQGTIQLVTPDGKQLQSRPIGLSYDDGVNTVLIAELKDSAGYVVGANQVIYPDAFTGFKADVRCIYTKAGFEQDIILREQPPTPESFGLNPVTARLQVLTEFFNPPQPKTKTTALPEQAGISMTDENLDFGIMKMAPGRAFLIGDEADSSAGNVLVGKQWVQMAGRQILVEGEPVAALADDLSTLPVPQVAAVKPGGNSVLHVVSAKRLLPAQRLAKTVPSIQPMQMARATAPSRGLVLDYQTLNSSQTNYTFQGDTTYYISGTVNLYGTNTFEGGAVIKYATNASIVLQSTHLNWQASAYRPVVFTAMDDNSMGEAFGSGNPSSYYANPALSFCNGTSPTLSNFRIAYARQALFANSGNYTFYDCQFVNCQKGTYFQQAGIYFRNALFSRVMTNFYNNSAGSIDLQNVSIDSSAVLGAMGYGSVTMANCILANVTNLSVSVSGSSNGFYRCPRFGTGVTNIFYPFQAVGGGNYYLANGCNFFNAGTTNIDSTLLADLMKKTTYPPIVYSNIQITAPATFSPQAQRDTDTPDLGYHYDPLDYVFGGADAYSNLTFAAGTALGWFDGGPWASWGGAGYGISLNGSATAAFGGTATAPCIFSKFSMVQEVSGGNWINEGYLGGFIGLGGNNTADTAPTVVFQFTRCFVRNYEDNICRDSGDGTLLVVRAMNSEFYDGGASGYLMYYYCTNCLFMRVIWGPHCDCSPSLSLRNCTFYGGSLYADHGSGTTWPVWIENCAFDGTDFSNVNDYSDGNTNITYCDYNAFLTNANRLPMHGTHDVTNIISFNWQTSYLSNFYLPTNSWLINAGSVTADIVGLYHYTTQTNQVKETNSVMDIGYHYVAVDTNGNPMDSNGDGIPDYLQDANGNGLVDSGETNWGLAILTQPASQIVPWGTNVTFAVTAQGIAPLSYQWYFNGTNAIGATNSSLNLTNVQAVNQGNYLVVVTNVMGRMTSSVATLTFTCDVSPSGLVAWWQAESNALDSVGTNNGALSTNGASFVTGKVGLAFNFDGTNGAVQIPDSPVLRPTNLTIEVWVRFNSLNSKTNGNAPLGEAFLVEKPNHVGADGYVLYKLRDTGSPYKDFFGFGVNTNEHWPVNVTSMPMIQTNQWYQVVGVRGSNYIQLYTNGVLAATTSVGFPQDYGNYPLYFGTSGGNTAGWDARLAGCLDEVSLYNRALSSNEIAALYNAGSAGKCQLPPTITTQPASQITNMGGAVTFTIAATGSPRLSYQWYFNGTNRLGGATNTSLTLTNVQTTNAGNYSVVVTNVAGSATSSNAVLTVNNPSPSVQITSPTNQTLLARSNVIISATATNTATGVTISWVEFFANATNSLGFAAVPTNGFYQLNWIPPTGGTTILTALAMDSHTNTAWSAPVTNYVRNLPIVTITSPTNGQVFPVCPTNITLSATAVADLATITNVIFYQGTNIVGTTNMCSPYYTVTWTNVTSGSYTLHAQATENTGVSGISSNIVVIVEPTNRPPAVFVGPNQTNYLSTNALLLTGFVSDDGLPYGNTLTVTWTNLNGGTNVTFVNSNLPITSAYFWATGTYVLRLSANDSQYTTSSNITVTVLPANQPPYVYAGTNQTIILPALANTNPLQLVTLVPTLTQIAPGQNIFAGGIDYYAPSNCLILSVQSSYCSTNFQLMLADGTMIPFTCISNLEDETISLQQIRTVRSTLGGFKIGTMFTGAGGVDGIIMRVDPDGTIVGTNVWTDYRGYVRSNAWVVLTNQNGSGGVGWASGGLWLDGTGVWGGDLIVLTVKSAAGDDTGNPYYEIGTAYLWRINSAGKATLITSLPQSNRRAGVATIPNDVQKYGPWAGRILVEGGTGWTTDAPIYAIDTNGFVATDNLKCGGGDFNIIPENENLFVWKDNTDGTVSIETVPAFEFQGMAGDIFLLDYNAWLGNLPQGGHLYRVRWNGNNFDIFPLVSDNQIWMGANFIPAGPLSLPPTAVQLNGIITDDGEVFRSTSNAWNVVSGPGAVTFGDPTQTNTTAEFSVAGDYILQLSAYDGQYDSSSNVTIHVLRNQAPVVSAGTNQIITNLNTTLYGNVSDDGLPLGITNIVWTEVSGPGRVFITASNQAQTSITFSEWVQQGTYVLMLTADDGQATNSAQVMITVKSASLTLTPSYGSATLTNTYYPVTARLVSSNGSPIPYVTVNFTVTGANSTSGQATTDVNGNAGFSYQGVHNGRDSIQANAIVAGYLINSRSVIKDWGRSINCGDVYLGQLDGGGGSLAREWPTNGQYYADYYVFSGSAGDSIKLTLGQEFIGGYYPKPGWPLLLLLRDPSDQLVAVSPPCAAAGHTVSLNYTIPTSGDYVIEVATIAGNIMAKYDLYLSCCCDTSAPSEMQVLFNGTNIPNGGSIIFPATAQGVATNVSLVITNSGQVPFAITTLGTTGDFGLSNTVFGWVSPGNSTNLGIIFNASASGLSSGALILGTNNVTGNYNIVYLMANTFPTSAPPAVQLIAPPDGSTFLDSQSVQFTAAVTLGGAFIPSSATVELEYVTTNNITLGTLLSLDSNNNYSATVTLGNGHTLADGDHTITAIATDANNQSGTAPPIIIHVLPFHSTTPTQSPNMQVLYHGTNVPSGSTIVFPPTTPGAPTNILLVITNSGNYPLGVISVGKNGDFTLANSVLNNITFPGGSTNLGITFNASTNGVSVGALGLGNNAGNGGYYVVYFVGNAFPPGSGPPSNTNQPPVAVNDEFTVLANSVNNILNPLANDYDTNGNPLTIIAVTSSDGGTATIINNGTRINYTPPQNIRSITNNGVTYPADGFYYEISDGHGGTAWGTIYMLIVASDMPLVTLTASNYNITAGNPDPLAASVTPSDNIVKVDFYLGKTLIGEMTNGVNGFYTNNWLALYDNCNCAFLASATDKFGQVGVSQPIHINVTPPTNGTLVAALDSMTNSSGTTPFTNCVLVRDGIFNLNGRTIHSLGSNVVWQLGVYTSDGTTLLRNLTPAVTSPVGTTNVPGVLLTNCDLTTLMNGVYDLRLTVSGGYRLATADVQFRLESNLKIGQFSFSQQDLVIPVNGIPLTVTRTYNSINPDKGDFGYSWTYALNDMDVSIDESRENVVDLDGNVFSQRAGGSWDVTLTLPNGQRTTFYFYLYPGSSGTYYAQWQAAPGATATLTTTDDNKLQTLIGGLSGNSDLFYWEAAGPDTPMNAFDFSSFILTTQDGTQYIISREDQDEHFVLDGGGGYYVQAYGKPYLSQINERSGDAITINPNSIVYTASNGVSRQIGIQRVGGLIASISDPNGAAPGVPPAVKYEYDTSQNLIDVQNLVDRSGTGTYVTNFFAYTNVNFPHYITGIINADGTQVAKNFYDDSGELIAVQDANGNLTRFFHNTTNNMEVVIDRLGNTNTYVYDTRGNVTTQINALGQVTTMAYDVFNNKTNETIFTNGQPYAINSYVYNTNLNVMIASTDPLSHTNGFTYDNNGDLHTSADAFGNTTTNFYDASTGNLLGTSDALGNTTTNIYFNSLLFGSRDAVGTVTTNKYDSTNNLIATTSVASGAILSSNTFTCDANGNRLTSTVWRRTNNVWTGAVTKFVYDAMNRVVQTIDPDGGTNTVVYDPTGKQQATIDKLGHKTTYDYDNQGRLWRTTYPDLTTEKSTYDAGGNRIKSMDRLNRATTYVYDALNRVTNAIYADFTTTTTVYDGVGRVAQTIDARGTITGFNYDAAGRRLAVTNAFGISGVAVTNFYGYDANGNQITFTDGLRHTTTNFYDALNRQTNVTFADGTKQITMYDAGGRRIAGVDQAGITNGFVYDGLGRLIFVTNALGKVTRYQYDEAGNETAQIDALNRTNRFAYDGMGRRILHTRPDNLMEGFAYDRAGNLTCHTNFNNYSIIYNQYDAMNRLTNSTDNRTFGIVYTYTATGQRQSMTNASGTATYSYDNRDRLLRKIVTWNGSGPFVSLNYRYDANGNVTNLYSSMANGVSLIYGYDALNRLTNVLSHGQLAASYQFDAAGNLAAMRYGNGMTNQYQYDSLNRLTNLAWKYSSSPRASFAYQLGLSGNRTNLTETINSQPSALNYTYAWQYDNLYRLTNETVTGTAPTGTIGYGYDAVGNRTIRTNIASGLGLTNQSLTFTTNDWLAGDIYDNNGNTTQSGSGGNSYYYNGMNQLVNFYSNYSLYISCQYDGDGNRVYKSGPETIYYLVDDRNPSGSPQVVEEYQNVFFVYQWLPVLNRVYNYGLGLISQQQFDPNTQFPSVLSYYGHDGHGSVRFLTDTNGSITDTYTYDAYGNLISETPSSGGQTPNNYLYAGQQWDPDLGMYYNRARYWNTGTGRFWTMDTYQGNNEDPLSLHKYLYCQGNPVNGIDPSGENYYFGGNPGGTGIMDRGHFWVAVDSGWGVLRFDYRMAHHEGGSSGTAVASLATKGEGKARHFFTIREAAGTDQFYAFDESSTDDFAMSQRMQLEESYPSDYYLFRHNCGHESFDIAQHGWPSLVPPDLATPAAFLQVVKQHWPRGSGVDLSPKVLNVSVNAITSLTFTLTLPDLL